MYQLLNGLWFPFYSYRLYKLWLAYKPIKSIYILNNALDIHTAFLVLWICVFKKYFLSQNKMALLSVISLNEMKSLTLTTRRTHHEISNILKERHSDMRGLSAMNIRQFSIENGIRTGQLWSYKEVTKFTAEVINEFSQNIVRKNAVLLLKVFTILWEFLYWKKKLGMH